MTHEQENAGIVWMGMKPEEGLCLNLPGRPKLYEGLLGQGPASKEMGKSS